MGRPYEICIAFKGDLGDRLRAATRPRKIAAFVREAVEEKLALRDENARNVQR